MMKYYDENVNKPTLIKNSYKIDTWYGDTWYGVYTNGKVKKGRLNYSLSGFAVAHKNIIISQHSLSINPSTNGRIACDIRNEEGEWVKLKSPTKIG